MSDERRDNRMVQHHKFIDIVHRLGEKDYELKGVYRRIQDRALFLAAYGKLYANAGATTRGTDPEDTVDGMSLERIDTILHTVPEVKDPPDGVNLLRRPAQIEFHRIRFH